MSKRIYTTKGDKTDEYCNYDGSGGWYKEVSDEEFGDLAIHGRIRHANGRFFATGSFEEARIASGKMGPAPAEAAAEESAREKKAQPQASSGGLYANPGATLKAIASVVFVIGAIGSLILAISLGGVFATFGSSFFVAFLGVLILGVLISYLSGLGLAALGDIAKNLNEINRKIR